MQEWEIYEFYSMLQYADTAQWEQTRWLMYVVAQVNSRKQLKLTDILKFPWEEASIIKDTSISNEDIKRLKEKAEQIRKDLFNKG